MRPYRFDQSEYKETQAETLPAGWRWVVYEDHSGSLKSPDNKRYFSFDGNTNEYQIEKKIKLGIWSARGLYGAGRKMD